jgi:adenylate cyclase
VSGITAAFKGFPEIDKCNETAWELRNDDTKRALDLSLEALRLAQEEVYPKGMALAYRNIGVCQYLLSNYDAALSDSINALELLEQLQDEIGKATALNTIGNVYQSLGDYPNALDYHTRSLKVRQNAGDLQGESISLTNIGNVYQKLGDFKNALEYYQQSLIIKKQTHDKQGEGILLANIGNVYLALGDETKTIEYYSDSLTIAKETNDRRGEANALLNIGSFNHSMGDTQNALEYHFKAFDIFKEIEDKGSVVRTLNNIGLILNAMSDAKTATEYLQSALGIAEEINSKELIYDACKGLAESHELLGDYKNALDYFKLYHQFKQDVYSEDASRKVRGLQTKYEVESVEKEKEIYRLKNVEIKAEQEKSERLLLNILPLTVANRLKKGEYVIADNFNDATVMFADIVGFTVMSTLYTPDTLIAMLNEVFSGFDTISEKYSLEKIKTIGDAYMAVAGVPVPQDDHAERVAAAALDMMKEMKRINEMTKKNIGIRIGINTGAVVAGVIGSKKFIYDLWGDTVNIASRMESHSSAGEIQVTEATYERLKTKFIFDRRGSIEVKGKGAMQTYFLKEKIEWE